MDFAADADERGHPALHIPTERRPPVVELKVHGVSGTPATTLLEYPPELIELVYGDQDAGFHRRRDVSLDHTVDGSGPTELDDEPEGTRQTEAFCWGGLTSGPATRALWLLFLPFIFVNLAHWMLPPTEHKRWASWSVRLLRLLGLTLTMALSLSLMSVAVDIVGWQCAGLPQCAERLGPLTYLSTWPAGVRLAVTAVPVLAMAAVLLLMQKQSLRIGEPPPDAAEVTPTGSPLTQPRFWNGDRSVTRLRDCHLTAWFSLAAALTLGASRSIADGAPRWPTTVLLAVNMGFVVTSVGLTCCDRVTARGGHGLPGDQTDRPSQATRRMWLSSLVVCLASLGWVLGSHLWAAKQSVGATIVVTGPLPYLGAVTEWLIGIQAVLLIGLLLTTWRSKQPPAQPHDGFRPTLKGLTAPCVALLAWLISGEMSVAVSFWVARLLGEPVQSAQAADALARQAAEQLHAAASEVVGLAGTDASTGSAESSSKILGDFVAAANGPAPLQLFDTYFIGSVVNLVVIVAVIGIAVYAGATTWLRGRKPGALSSTWGDYGGAEAQAQADTDAHSTAASRDEKQRKMLALMKTSRVKAISSVRAWAALTDRAPTIVLALIIASLFGTSAFVGISVVVALTRQGRHDLASWFGEHHPAWTQLLAAGQAMTALVASVAIALAYQAFRNRETRRRVAVLWDVVTFWPRASHPLGPPCYGERAVPDLWLRTSLLTTHSNVVIAAHSQGSVIAAAALLMNADSENPESLKPDERPLLSRPVALLTFGSVLRRLYARNFPAHFGFQSLDLLNKNADAGTTAHKRWVNLWALTDPLGGWIFDEDLRPPPTGIEAGPVVDRRLADAEGLGPVKGRYPPICGHTGFWTRPEYTDALAALRSRIVTPSRRRPHRPSSTEIDFQTPTTPADRDTRSLIPYRLPGPCE